MPEPAVQPIPPSLPAAAAATSPAPDAAHRELSSAVRATSLVTLASRFGGLLRDVLLGRIFGATALNTAFQAAFAIPNMFRRLFGEGALSAAFIPEYTRARQSDPDLANRLASLTIALLAAVTAGLTIIIEIALALVLIFGAHSPERRLLIELVMVMLPFMPLICLVAILAGMLQVHGRYGAAASGPLVLNAFIIGVGLYAVLTNCQADVTIAFILGIATVLSAATQLVWFLRLLRPHVRWTRGFSAARARARDMLRKFVPVAIGLGTLQLNTFLDTTIATFPLWYQPKAKGIPFPLDEASGGILSLTSRLYQFPLGVFGIAVATAAFPLLARHASDPALFTGTLRRGLRLSLFIGLPATLGLIAVRSDVVAVLFGHGASGWKPEQTARSAAVLLGFSAGIWAYSLNHVLTRAFYARGDTLTPMKLAVAALVLNLALNLTLIWALDEAGMAWATSLAAMAQCAALLFLARRRLIGGPLFDAAALRAIGRIVLASLIMFGLALLAARFTPARSTWTGQLLALIAACTAGGASYLVLARLMGIEELRWLLRRRAA